MRHGYFPRIALMFQCEGEYPRQFSFDFQLKIIGRVGSDADSVAEVQFSPVLPPFFENREQNRQIFFRTEQNRNRTI